MPQPPTTLIALLHCMSTMPPFHPAHYCLLSIQWSIGLYTALSISKSTILSLTHRAVFIIVLCLTTDLFALPIRCVVCVRVMLRTGRLCCVVVRQLWLLSHSLLGACFLPNSHSVQFRQRPHRYFVAAVHGKRRFSTPVTKAQVAQSLRLLIATYLCLMLVLDCGPVSAQRTCGMGTDRSRLRKSSDLGPERQ